MKSRNIIFGSFLEFFYKLMSHPTPSSITYFWNLGSMMGIVLFFQIVTGFFLSMHYSVDMAYDSVVHISRDVWWGMEVRTLHSNGASLFFLLIFFHMGRGMMNLSFSKTGTWVTGMLMFFLLMATAFMGYVLPWGQMSLWGATVITSLVSVIPFVGKGSVLYLLWGGDSIGLPTLNRFFSVHYILPFLILLLMFFHVFMLHSEGSSNPLSVSSDMESTNFNPFFVWKDLVFPAFIIFFMFVLSWKFPQFFMDPENYSPANPMSTPTFIKPEWYFLHLYALLRAVPNETGGVVVLLLMMFSPFFFLFSSYTYSGYSFSFYHSSRMFFVFLFFFILMWLGAMPPEPLYIFMSRLAGTMYFLFILF